MGWGGGLLQKAFHGKWEQSSPSEAFSELGVIECKRQCKLKDSKVQPAPFQTLDLISVLPRDGQVKIVDDYNLQCKL